MTKNTEAKYRMDISKKRGNLVFNSSGECRHIVLLWKVQNMYNLEETRLELAREGASLNLWPEKV